MKTKKKAIVTGGAGFIGSHMVDLLLSKNYKVYVIDNLSGGHKKNLNHHQNNTNLKFVKIDICKLKSNNRIFKDVNYVFHFAGIGDIVPSIENPSNYMQTNVQGTINVLEASRHFKVKKFIYAASASCYGMTKKLTNENYRISIEHPYGLSKYLGEKAAMHWHQVYDLQVNSIRIFNAYGPRVRTTGAYGAVIGVFFKQKIKNRPLTIVGNGKQTRDFVHVKDVARAFYAAVSTKTSGRIYNVGTGKPQSVNYLAKLIGGKKINIPDRPGEPKTSSADISKIKRELKWKPLISFDNGIRSMLKNIHKWKDAPLWTPNKIKKATHIWFKYLKKK
jgi:UDP-glucose 4-epimerase